VAGKRNAPAATLGSWIPAAWIGLTDAFRFHLINRVDNVVRLIFRDNNLRFDEHACFQQRLALPDQMRERILREAKQLDCNTVPKAQ
jgi:hypothetical protein